MTRSRQFKMTILEVIKRSALAGLLFFLNAHGAGAARTIDMKGSPFFQPALRSAAQAVRNNLTKETKVAGVRVRVDLGNQGEVSVKSAVLAVEQTFPLKGKASIVLDLHFRHVVTPERTVLGIRIPAVVAYDRHEEIPVEYDINTGTARARVLKGPFQLASLPVQDYDIWINLDLRRQAR